MFRFIFYRLLQTIPVLWAVVTLTFIMLRMAPGGPFDREKKVSKEIEAAINAHYGLDKPRYQQYLAYLGNLLHGDLGPSYKYSTRSVNSIIADAFPVSMELGMYSMAIALAAGLAAGIVASLKPNSLTDYIPSSLAMVGICLPTFVLGPLLILFFVLKHAWFPVVGWEDLAAAKVLPSVTLGLYFAAYVARLTRGGMLEVLSHDFIRTARAKGASEPRVILKHALRGGILPVVSYLGPAVAGLIAGSFVVETIFNVPGLGRHFITSAFNRDYTLLNGVVVFYAVLVVFFNLIVDIVQVWLNPRLKFE